MLPDYGYSIWKVLWTANHHRSSFYFWLRQCFYRCAIVEIWFSDWDSCPCSMILHNFFWFYNYISHGIHQCRYERITIQDKHLGALRDNSYISITVPSFLTHISHDHDHGSPHSKPASSLTLCSCLHARFTPHTRTVNKFTNQPAPIPTPFDDSHWLAWQCQWYQSVAWKNLISIKDHKIYPRPRTSQWKGRW